MSILAWMLALCPYLASPDSTLAARARARHDTVAARNDGGRLGIDPRWIHLGAFSLPTAMLGAVPLDATSNPVLGAREAQLDAMRADIAWHASQVFDRPAQPRSVQQTRVGDAFTPDPVIPQP